MQAGSTPGAMGPPPPPYRATEVSEDEARLTKRRKVESSGTYDSTESVQFAPSTNAAIELSPASQQLATALDDNRSSHVSHTYEFYPSLLPHNVYLFSNRDIYPGYILKAQLPEALKNPSYVIYKSQLVYRARGDYMIKERYWVVTTSMVQTYPSSS